MASKPSAAAQGYLQQRRSIDIDAGPKAAGRRMVEVPQRAVAPADCHPGYSGILLKQGIGNRTWKRRWFMLPRGSDRLLWFSEEHRGARVTSATPKGTIQVVGISERIEAVSAGFAFDVWGRYLNKGDAGGGAGAPVVKSSGLVRTMLRRKLGARDGSNDPATNDATRYRLAATLQGEAAAWQAALNTCLVAAGRKPAGATVPLSADQHADQPAAVVDHLPAASEPAPEAAAPTRPPPAATPATAAPPAPAAPPASMKPTPPAPTAPPPPPSVPSELAPASNPPAAAADGAGSDAGAKAARPAPAAHEAEAEAASTLRAKAAEAAVAEEAARAASQVAAEERAAEAAEERAAEAAEERAAEGAALAQAALRSDDDAALYEIVLSLCRTEGELSEEAEGTLFDLLESHPNAFTRPSGEHAICPVRASADTALSTAAALSAAAALSCVADAAHAHRRPPSRP